MGPLSIAYAGTASSSRFRGFFENSYNIITIEDGGRQTVEIKVVGGDKMPLVNLVDNYKPFLDGYLGILILMHKNSLSIMIPDLTIRAFNSVQQPLTKDKFSEKPIA